MNKKEKFQQKILFWFDKRYEKVNSDRIIDLMGSIHDGIQNMICFMFGHSPTTDQCGKPEHDFCLWCMKLTPFKAERKSMNS